MNNWVQIVMSALSALAGGFIGGCLVAYRMGRWRQWVESKIGEHDKRLEKGNPAVDQVPILMTRVEAIIATLDEFKEAFRDFVGRVVTKDECDRRHEGGRQGKD